MLSSGTAIAQGIAFGFLPVLTRLYAPEDFGVLSLYLSIVGICNIFGSMRYEAMIILPRADRDAAQLVRLVFLISITAAGFFFVIVLFFREQIAVFFGNPDVAPWLFFIPVSIFFYSNCQALRYWAMRLQKFGLVSQGLIVKTTVNYLSATGIKFAGIPLQNGGGLVIGTLLSNIVNYFWLFLVCSKKDSISLKNKDKKRLVGMAKNYRPMAVILTVSHGIATLNAHVPVFMVSSFFGSAVLGMFSISERIASAPSQLIANAIGDVYRQRAAVLFNEKGHFERLMIKTLVMTSILAIVPYSMGVIFAPDIFKMVLGPEWEEAGRYASIVMIGGFFSFVISPIDKGAIIVGAKKYIFTWHMLRLAGNIILLAGLFFFSFSVYQLLWGLVALQVSLYLLDIVIEYKYARGK